MSNPFSSALKGPVKAVKSVGDKISKGLPGTGSNHNDDTNNQESDMSTISKSDPFAKGKNKSETPKKNPFSKGLNSIKEGSETFFQNITSPVKDGINILKGQSSHDAPPMIKEEIVTEEDKGDDEEFNDATTVASKETKETTDKEEKNKKIEPPKDSSDNIIAATTSKSMEFMKRGVTGAIDLVKKPVQQKLSRGMDSDISAKENGSNKKVSSRDIYGSDDQQSTVASVPPDEVLQKMDIIIENKKFKNITVKEFYDRCWSEGSTASDNSEMKPMYGPWLEKSGKFDIDIEDWTLTEKGEEFIGPWCGEKYNQQRIVKFKFKRTTHLYTGPPIADVIQTHYCRLEGNDKCVFAISIEMIGIPFADTFNVEIRWVARRIGEKNLSVSVGLFVNFVKWTMVESKIRSGTGSETTKTQLDLFKHVEEACNRLSSNDIEDDDDDEFHDAQEDHEVEEGERQVVNCSVILDFFAKLLKGDFCKDKKRKMV